MARMGSCHSSTKTYACVPCYDPVKFQPVYELKPVGRQGAGDKPPVPMVVGRICRHQTRQPGRQDASPRHRRCRGTNDWRAAERRSGGRAGCHSPPRVASCISSAALRPRAARRSAPAEPSWCVAGPLPCHEAAREPDRVSRPTPGDLRDLWRPDAGRQSERLRATSRHCSSRHDTAAEDDTAVRCRRADGYPAAPLPRVQTEPHVPVLGSRGHVSAVVHGRRPAVDCHACDASC